MPDRLRCLYACPLLLSSIACISAASTADQPNVLLILTDDQGYGDIQSHGNPILKTPRLDALAESGARFDRFFVSPVCAPTRASLLTGRYHMRTGVSGVTRGYETLRSDEWTLAEMFSEAGYATGCFGKWHNGRHMPNHPNGQGFDEFVGFCGGHWNTYFDPPMERNGKPVVAKGYIADALTESAIDFIRRHKDKPFFCYVPYNTPHSPWRALDSDWSRYNDQGLDAKAQAAYAMVRNLDRNVGRLLDALDTQGVADSTIVLFLTDNGANSPRYNAAMRGRKGSVDEGGVRVPFFIRFPGRVAPGTTIRRNTCHMDILPTLADWCGVSISQARRRRLDGRSFAKLVRGDDSDWTDRALVTARFRAGDSFEEFNAAVRDDRWRATRIRGKWRLYDMIEDPSQLRDIASANPQQVERCRDVLERWFASVMATPPDLPRIPLGHPSREIYFLPANESQLHPGWGEGIEWTGDTQSGFANCWIRHWTLSDAYPIWQVDVLTEGRYAFELEYACRREDVGCQMTLHIGDRRLVRNVGRAHDPPLADKPDRVFSNNYQDKASWASLPMGELTLQKGPVDLKLTTKIVRERSIELYRIVVRQVGP